MAGKVLYTIGYGSRDFEKFLELLVRYEIKFLIDVRTSPYSKMNPPFNKENLDIKLKENKIKYVFMGDSLGGRPRDLSCYDEEGKVDYDVIKTRKFFLEGIDRLKTAYSKKIKVALMCSEGKPSDCHRSKLIGSFLHAEKIEIEHIDENGNLKDQATVINEVTKGLNTTDLFGNPTGLTSRKAYQ
ncbi:Protein of unknown function, DUF488 [Mucilaginibacter pineti]|uniref:DUF488 domain-containing protein n=1 Tax=Mucilaginibacter pineti TaxID=1391627 RepID=A0A1G7L4U0_9SPHI|nr:DUF488 domain-containing protein [Mucilaginibacter pineti]SDF44508.1 Protein of unknown function, DUF488 [Mucilaginibacter pineti]